MDFSLILPTRNRIQKLTEFLDSIQNTTCNLSKIEILICYDNDDNETSSFINDNRFKNCDIKWIKGSRSFNFSKDYYNEMAKVAKGKFIWALNDDVSFVTKNWDTILTEAIEKFLIDKNDRIAYIGTYDNTDSGHESPERRNGYCCFPMVTKETIDTSGKMFPETVPTWGGDGALWDIFEKIPDRILNARSLVKLNHKCIHNGHDRDEVSIEIERRFIQNKISINERRKELNEIVLSITNKLNRDVTLFTPENYPKPPHPVNESKTNIRPSTPVIKTRPINQKRIFNVRRKFKR